MKELLSNKYTIKNGCVCPFCFGRVGSRQATSMRIGGSCYSTNICNRNEHAFSYQTKRLVPMNDYIKYLIKNKIV
jgi:hypothetical protein